MKKYIYLLFLLPVLFFAGCNQNNNEGGSDETHSAPEGLGVASCNNYVDYMSCIADELGDAGRATKVALDKTVNAWEKMPVEQLEQICQAAINGVSQVLDMYKDYDCTLEGAVPVDRQENDDEEEMVNDESVEEDVASAEAGLEVVEIDDTQEETENREVNVENESDAQATDDEGIERE